MNAIYSGFRNASNYCLAEETMETVSELKAELDKQRALHPVSMFDEMHADVIAAQDAYLAAVAVEDAKAGRKVHETICHIRNA